MTRFLLTLAISLTIAFTVAVTAVQIEPQTEPMPSETTITTKDEEKPLKPAESKPEPAPKPEPVVQTGSTQQIKASIIKWADHYGLSSTRMLRIANCESTFRPSAVNYNYYAGGGHPTGLFQYLPETWNRIGSRSPYGVGDIWNYEHQSRVTAWAFANGYAGEWACK